MMYIVMASLVAISAVFFAADYYRPYPVAQPDTAAVVISGCSSGIGFETAVYLAERGFHVYAGVRRASDFDIFKQNPLVTPVLLDVTNTTSIAEAVEFVQHDLVLSHHATVKLAAVVNNAGIGYLSAVQEIDLNLFRTLMDINVVGALDLVQQFLPLLMEGAAAGAGGRIVSVGSVSGFLATPLMGAYAASKFAMEALNDALRAEIGLHGISVSLVQPGTILGTRIRSKRIRDEASGRYSPPDHFPGATPTLATLGENSPYSRLYASTRERLRLADESGVGDPPSVVAAAIHHAITSAYPQPRYTVGRVGKVPAWVVEILKRMLPTRLIDAVIVAMMMRE